MTYNGAAVEEVPSAVFEGGALTGAAAPAPLYPNSPPGTAQVSSMKKWLWILAIVFAAAAAFGQTSNTLYARNFPGNTVGAKVTAAQNACDPDTSMRCVIVIDAGLSAYPVGTMPSKCPNCTWWDLRQGTDFPGLELTTTGSSGASTLQNGVLNIPDYAGGSSGAPLSLNPPTQRYVLFGDSYSGDDINALHTNVAINSFTCSASVCTLTVPSTSTFTAGNWAQIVDTASQPSFDVSLCATTEAHDAGVGWPYGCSMYQILTAGFTSTTFEVANPTGTAQSCSSSCGSVGPMNDYIGPQMQAQPAIQGHGTVSWLMCSNSSGGNTLAFISANFSSCFQAYAPGTSADPIDYILGAWSDDMAAGETAAQIEGYISTVAEEVHAVGGRFLVQTSPALKNTQTAALVDYWLRGMTETPANKVTGDYVDWQFDEGPKYNPLGTFWDGTGSMLPAGVRRMAHALNIVAGLNLPIDTSQQGEEITDGNGAIWHYQQTVNDTWNFSAANGDGGVAVSPFAASDLTSDSPTIFTAYYGQSNTLPGGGLTGLLYLPNNADCYNMNSTSNDWCGIAFGANTSDVNTNGAFTAENPSTGDVLIRNLNSADLGITVTPSGGVVAPELANATCISAAADGTLTAGCPTITTTIERLNITSGICTTTGAETLCSMAETWPTAFANNTYTVTCGYAGLPTGTGTNPGLYGPYVSAKTTTGFTLTIQAGSNSAGGNNTVTEIDCWGMD